MSNTIETRYTVAEIVADVSIAVDAEAPLIELRAQMEKAAGASRDAFANAAFKIVHFAEASGWDMTARTEANGPKQWGGKDRTALNKAMAETGMADDTVKNWLTACLFLVNQSRPMRKAFREGIDAFTAALEAEGIAGIADARKWRTDLKKDQVDKANKAKAAELRAAAALEEADGDDDTAAALNAEADAIDAERDAAKGEAGEKGAGNPNALDKLTGDELITMAIACYSRLSAGERAAFLSRALTISREAGDKGAELVEAAKLTA